MDSEDELLCSCCCDKTEEKNYEKEEKTLGMGSAHLKRKRGNMAYHILRNKWGFLTENNISSK